MGGGVDSTERTPTRKIYGQQMRQEQRLTTKYIWKAIPKKRIEQNVERNNRVFSKLIV